jgi:hypothetical protein
LQSTKAHHCAYFGINAQVAGYPAAYTEISEGFSFELVFTMPAHMEPYEGSIQILKPGGGAYPNRILKVTTVSLEPGVPSSPIVVDFPSEYIEEIMQLHDEDTAFFPVNAYLLDSECPDELVINSHVQIKVYKQRENTSVAEALTSGSILLFPNPVGSGGEIYLYTDQPIQIEAAYLYSSAGTVVEVLTAGTATERKISIEGMAQGVYLLELIADNKKIKKKLIIE